VTLPPQFSPAKNALLQAAQSMIHDSNNEITVSDDDVKQWLYSAQQLAVRAHSTAIAQVAAQGQDAPEGVFTDAADYWGVHPVQLLQAAGDAIKTPLEGAAVFAAVALAAWLILPPVIRALRT
jgi:hypothetical protein